MLLKLFIVAFFIKVYCSATIQNLQVLEGEISGEDFVGKFLSNKVPVIMKSSVTSWPLYQALNGDDDLLTDLTGVKLSTDTLEESQLKSRLFGEFLATQNSDSFKLKVSKSFPVLQKLILLPSAIVTCKQILDAYMRSGGAELVGNKTAYDVASLLTSSDRHSMIALVSGEIKVSYPGHAQVAISAGDLYYSPPHTAPILLLAARAVYVRFSWNADQMFDPSLCDVRPPLYALTHDIDADDDQVYIDYTVPDGVLNTGYRIPPIGLGTARLFEQTYVTIKFALQLGYRLFDTARSYSGEERRDEFETSSEHEIGRALADCDVPRSELFLITKVPPEDMTYNRTIASVTESLSRLGTDYLDAVLIHSFSSVEDPQEGANPWECWKALEDLQSRGLIRSIGVSNIKEQDLLRLILNFTRRNVSLVQNWFDPFHQDTKVREVCRQHNITYMGYSTLGALWSGERGLGYRINPVLNHPTIVRAAFSADIPASSFVLQWAIERNVVVIPCSRDPEHLDKNLQVRHLVPIEPTAGEWLDGLDGRLGNPEDFSWKKSDYDDVITTSSGRDEL